MTDSSEPRTEPHGLRQYAAPLTKAEMAYRHIREEIVEGELPPDTVLDQESLAARLGFSTTPVREALRLLETEGLVANRSHHRTVVTPLSLEMLEETYAIRLNLDPLAVSLAAKNASPDDRKLFRLIVDESAYEDTPRARCRINRRFHRAIYSASGNSVLTQILDGLWDRTDRYRMMTLQSEVNAQIALKEHDELAEAVIAGQVEAAAEMMRSHVAESLRRMRSELSKDE